MPTHLIEFTRFRVTGHVSKIESFVGVYRMLAYSRQPPGPVYDERRGTTAWLTGEGIA